MRTLLVVILLIVYAECGAQQQTGVSLYLKKDKLPLDSIESASGNLFKKLGHHGPAIENQWIGLRLYFDKRTAIDVYSKQKPGLEIREKHWYPSKKEQMDGWGADYYKVGRSIGLGGIRLWDGQALVPLHPVSKRSAKVVATSDSSYMEMLSSGVSFKDQTVDILIRVTVFSEKREAKVEAISMTTTPVQFASGINYFGNLKIEKGEDYIATWGIHPEDVAAEKVSVGAAILFNKDDFEKSIDDGSEYLLISKPLNHIETWITSANEREEVINSFEKFIREIENLEIN